MNKDTQSQTVKRKRGRPPASGTDGASEIKKAALEEFARSGFRGASIEQIAIRAGVAKPLVHYHFKSKDELWTKAVSEAFEKFQQLAQQFAEQLNTSTSGDLVTEFARTVVTFSSSHPELIRIAMDETYQESERGKWLTKTYLYPIHELTIDLLNHYAGLRNVDQDLKLAGLMIPSIFGAINFPYMDAELISDVYEIDVFSEQYKEKQIKFASLVFRAVVDKLGS